MKMEVLSVQNQFQGQFGVLGSAKVKDWTSPLTPPPHSNHHHHHHHHHRNGVTDDTLPSDISSDHHNHHTSTGTSVSTQSSRTSSSSSSSLSTSTSTSSTSSNTNNTTITNNNINNSNNHNQLQFATTLQYYHQQQKPDDASVNALSQRLQNELRAAKSRHLACTEVLLPDDLLHRVAAEIIKVSEKEPCGIRGCSIFIEFEDEPSNTRRIASLKVDPNTVSTFELYLTLKHDRSGWTSILPQFLKNLARSSTIMISHEFILTKNKLYHTFSE